LSIIKVNLLSAQYNPKRFKYWSSLHDDFPQTVLKMEYSPHIRFLRFYQQHGKGIWNKIEESAYYKLQKLYGRDRAWIVKKAKKFIRLYVDIKHRGFEGYIEILKHPMHKNKYNESYEIYEGHHRTACCIALGITEVEYEIPRLNK